MIDRERALRLAQAWLLIDMTGDPGHLGIDEHNARELSAAWFFPIRHNGDGVLLGGPQGYIVTKKTGKVYPVGSGASVDNTLSEFEAGAFRRYDVVITRVRDLDAAIKAIALVLPSQVVEAQYENGQVWRTGRSLTKEELRARAREMLQRVPCVLGDMGARQVANLDDAARDRVIDIELRERTEQ